MGQTPRKWTQVNQWYLGWPFGVHFMSPWSFWGPLFYVFIHQSELSEALIYDLFLKARFIYHIVYQNHYKHLLESQLSTLVFNICHHTQLLLPRVIKLNICLKNIQALLTTGWFLQMTDAANFIYEWSPRWSSRGFFLDLGHWESCTTLEALPRKIPSSDTCQ